MSPNLLVHIEQLVPCKRTIMIAAIYARKSTEENGVGLSAKLAKALKVTVAELVK
jgi:hypothetical protein